jgi:hypothetical protein
MVQTLTGQWLPPNEAGGCPKHKTWPQNPQFLLQPSSPGVFTFRLTCSGTLPVGFVLLKGGERRTRSKLDPSELAYRTKWKAGDSKAVDVQLEATPYVVIPSTFDPHLQSHFELQASGSTDFIFIPLPGGLAPPQPPAPALSAPAPASASGHAKGSASVYNDNGAVSHAAPSGLAKGAAGVHNDNGAVSRAALDGSVKVEVEGGGMSKQQQDAAAALIAAAVASCSGGRKYEDAAFPPTAASLWLDGRAPGPGTLQRDPVASWRRPDEMAGAGGPACLFKNGWEVEGVVPGALPNRWLLAACNIVGGDPEVAARCFVDATHAAQGFYVVRFYVDDPSSDDDWRVVLVDDRLPCGADGTPCFARCPTLSVLWVALIEKACAKLRGCYEATVGEMAVEHGLVLLTGGHAKSIEAHASQADALWQELMNAWTCSSVIGCEHQSGSGAAAAQLLATGLVPDQPYCAVTGGEMSPGRMIRLRALHGSPEWTGKWSDDDPSWTSQLRNLMHYSKDGNDGTFWISFGEFIKWFTHIYTCRMADDKWTKMTARSAWVDASAGGCPNYISWRHNPQWLLTVPRPSRLTLTMTLPMPEGAAAVAPPSMAVGLYIFRGNDGMDARRRKLVLQEGDVIVPSQPRFTRRLVEEISLPASDTPYVLMPFAFEPGQESPFTLVVQTDDRDEDGVADLRMEPVRPEDDWRSATLANHWSLSNGGGGPPSSTTFDSNPQLQLRVGSVSGRFFIFVESTGVTEDGRLHAGMQAGGSAYPSVGLAMHRAEPPLMQSVQPVASDGVMLQCRLEPSDTPYIISPFLQHPAQAVAAHPALGYRLTVYSDVDFQLGSSDPKCGGPKCDYNCRDCPMFDVYERLMRIEKGVDKHLAFLSQF